MNKNASSTDDFERERLGLLQDPLDPITAARLERLQIAPGWRCLEVAAGRGSIARWLADKVGPSGQVVATDIDIRFLNEHPLPNIEIRRHNILEDELETASYNLAHCRTILMHLPDPLRALKKIAAAVRPGGWLCIEELDFLSFAAVDQDNPLDQEFTLQIRKIADTLRSVHILDLYTGRRLWAWIEELGFEQTGNEGITAVERGGGPGSQFLIMTLQLAQPLVDHGVLTPANLELLTSRLGDPSFYFINATNFGAWGRCCR